MSFVISTLFQRCLLHKCVYYKRVYYKRKTRWAVPSKRILRNGRWIQF